MLLILCIALLAPSLKGPLYFRLLKKRHYPKHSFRWKEYLKPFLKESLRAYAANAYR